MESALRAAERPREREETGPCVARGKNGFYKLWLRRGRRLLFSRYRAGDPPTSPLGGRTTPVLPLRLSCVSKGRPVPGKVPEGGGTYGINPPDETGTPTLASAPRV